MIRVSALQIPFSYAATPQEFLDRVQAPIQRAAESGAELVVLPNYTGLMLLGAAVPAAEDQLEMGEIASRGGYASIRDMLRDAGSLLHDFHVHVFGALAAHFRIHVAAGSVIEYKDEALYNTAYVFGPEGAIAGKQRQTHRSAEEIAWGIQQGDRLHVFDLSIARVGLVVGNDVGYPEVSRILALQNANLLIHPAAYDTWYGEHYLVDLWREVQSNQVFGVQACAAGRYRGRSAVYAAVEMTEAENGILAQAERADDQEVISATLDFGELQRVVDSYPVFGFFNYGFYERELPAIYAQVENKI